MKINSDHREELLQYAYYLQTIPRGICTDEQNVIELLTRNLPKSLESC